MVTLESALRGRPLSCSIFWLTLLVFELASSFLVFPRTGRSRLIVLPGRTTLVPVHANRLLGGGNVGG